MGCGASSCYSNQDMAPDHIHGKNGLSLKKAGQNYDETDNGFSCQSSFEGGAQNKETTSTSGIDINANKHQRNYKKGMREIN